MDGHVLYGGSGKRNQVIAWSVWGEYITPTPSCEINDCFLITELTVFAGMIVSLLDIVDADGLLKNDMGKDVGNKLRACSTGSNQIWMYVTT